MIQFGQDAYPWWVALLLALAAAALLAFAYRPFRGLVRLPALWGMGAVRALALFLLAALLLAPFLRRFKPDPQGVRIAVLVDASGSMSTQDTTGDRTRLATAFSLLAKDAPLLPALERQGKVTQYLFSDQLFARGPQASATEFLPGNSALGDALRAASRERTNSARTLGGVVLLTDGHENAGSPATEAAKEYAAAGIPLSVIGIGEPGRRGDVRVDFVGERMTAVRGEPLTVPLRLQSTFGDTRKVVVTLSEGRDVLARREVEVGPDRPQNLQVEIAPPAAGLRVLRANLQPVPGDHNPATDVDYLALEVSDPLQLQIQWWSANPNWELRFVQRMIRNEEQLRLTSVVKAANNSWVIRRPDEEQPTNVTAATGTDPKQPAGAAPPDIGDGQAAGTAVPLPWNDLDLSNAAALVLDAELGPDLNEEVQEKIRGLVENRGIGLLVYGDPAKLPEKLRSVLPVNAVNNQAVGKDLVLEFDAGPVFGEDTVSALEGARLFLQGADRVHLATSLKPAARTLLSTPAGQSVLSLQAFGAGRIGYTGTLSTWRWHMRGQTSGEEYTAYWRGLLAFLGSTTKSRVTPLLHGRQVAVDDPVKLEADILGADFWPAPNARVTATLTRPDGQIEKIALNPSLLEPGRFEAPLQPRGAGEYQVEYDVELPGGEKLREESFFTASFAGAEMQDTAYHEELLRDLARITGGWFTHYSQLRPDAEIPLRQDVPVVEKRVYLADSWVYLIVIAVLLGGEWIVRRRYGMK
jgi:hypothetical protein